VCLADFCDVLQCDLLAAAQQQQQQPSREPPKPPRCSPAHLAQAQHRCTELLHACLPASGRERRARAALGAALCDKLSCSRIGELYTPAVLSRRSAAARVVRAAELLGIALLGLGLLTYYAMLLRSLGIWQALTGGQPAAKGGPRAERARGRAQQLLLGGRLGVRMAVTRLALVLMQRWKRRSNAAKAKRRS